MLDFGDRGIAVMIRIEGARLQEIRYGGPEEPDCDRLPPAGEVEARGNEPFWSINIDGAVARVRTPEELDGVHYGDGSWSRTEEERWRHRSQRQGPHGLETLILELMAERCTDTMSGAWFPFKAVLVRDDRRMEGCAVEGGRAGRTPPQ